MIKEKIAGHWVELYASVNMPLENYKKFNRFCLLDAGVGGDLNEIAERLNRVRAFIDSDKELAKQEIENLKTSLFLIAEEISPRYLCFAPLVHSLDGVKWTDLSDEGCKKLMHILRAEKTPRFDYLIALIKKKLRLN